MINNCSYSCLFALFILPCLLMASLKTMAIATNISTDQSALLALKAHITHDPSNTLAKNWTINNSVCTWFGVICGSRHKRVTSLDLSNMDLNGTIPPHLGNLSFLVRLRLPYNRFCGSLPAELSRLRRIKFFNFRSNNLTGEIPTWFGLLPKLEKLILDENEFSGPISETIFNASSPLQTISLHKNLLVSIPFSAISNMSLLREIDFAENMLSPSKIPAYMFNRLSKLEFLNLEENRFYGEMPSTLFGLKQMRELYLNFNNLSGNIPKEIKNLTLLTTLYLDNNTFKGTIPKEIGNLSMLIDIRIGSNGFHGQIPHEIGLPYLEYLEMENNNLYGLIPLTFFNISSMTVLALEENMLSGSLPSSLQLPNLQSFLLENNNFTGLVPKSLSNSSKLNLIDLSRNSFSGSISTFGKLKNLEILNLFDNYFSDDPDLPILTCLSQISNLKVLDLTFNPLKSILPISIGNLSSIQILYISSCEIRGVIPPEIGDLSSMIALVLIDNGLTGSIPSSIGRLRKLQEQGLRLDGNNLHGHIPNELCQLESLVGLRLLDNNISGLLPECLNRLTSLRYLYLGSNNITSTIPSSLWDLSYILELNVSSNFISGSLPPQIANLKVLTVLDLSRNKLSGNISSQIGDLQNLVALSLAHNQLQGSIPTSFGQLVSLELLDLSQNKLTGEIPKSLEALKYVNYINLSFNRLSGEIPIGGVFTNFSAESFMSNEALCGPSHLRVPPCKANARHQSEEGIPRSLKIIVPGIASAALILVLAYFLRKRIMGRMNHLSIASTKEFGALRRVSYFELQRATNGFADANVIGVGSFGTVYKGTLSDGKEAAVKVFNSQQRETCDIFDAECQVICNIRHRNLINVISSCSNLDFKAIVLDYMPNGSLEMWLYSPHYFLNIIQRLNILIDVAEALEYLHYGCFPSIVHCDLKPSNVLLDEDMVAHVADFGMAKLLGGGESLTQTMTLATIGYMAPEYGSEGVISTRSDAFSFGILVMETFTGKKPTDDMFSEGIRLKSWVENSFSHALTEIIDAKLISNGIDHFDSKKHYISSIMGVALDCCRETPQERANMKDVVAALKKIKPKLLKADCVSR